MLRNSGDEDIHPRQARRQENIRRRRKWWRSPDFVNMNLMTDTMVTATDCPFCKILAEHSDRMLAEHEHVFVIFSDPRLMPGHILVIPKRHVEKLSELPQNEKDELFKRVEEYEEKILKNVASGCDIRQNYRPFIKQGRLKVNHLHFHLQPREFEDDFYQNVQRFETDKFSPLSKEELEHYKELFKGV
jgi:histidine triad (HIT) family protein